jgi:hypothetical protein
VPVRNEARLGEHIAVAVKARVKSTPVAQRRVIWRQSVEPLLIVRPVLHGALLVGDQQNQVWRALGL